MMLKLGSFRNFLEAMATVVPIYVCTHTQKQVMHKDMVTLKLTSKMLPGSSWNYSVALVEFAFINLMEKRRG